MTNEQLLESGLIGRLESTFEALNKASRIYTTMKPKDAVINNNPPAPATGPVNVIADNPNWYGENLSRYLEGEVSAEEVAAVFAGPIDEAYSTGDHGALMWNSEKRARMQRGFHSKEKGEELWGPREPIRRPPKSSLEMPATECHLWDLWRTILEAARRTPWSDPTGQEKLVSLVRALKARPDPPMPERMTVAMRRDWIWSSGAVWSKAVLLGPSAREHWNGGPGGSGGFTLPQQHEWANDQGFVARLTANGTADFSMYMMWAMRNAFEQSYGNNTTRFDRNEVPKATWLGARVMAAAVWVLVAGETMYEKREREDEEWSGDELQLWPERPTDLPWDRSEVVNSSRWTFWRRGFQACSENETLTEEVRAMCGDAAAKIVSYEQAASH